MANFRPIWKDESFGVQTGDFSIYKVTGEDMQLIYSGHAVRHPGSSGPAPRASVYVNDIIADHLDSPDMADILENAASGRFTESPLLTTFRFYDGETLRGTASYAADWSYDYGYNYETQWKGMSFPITGYMSPGHPLLYTAVQALGVYVTVGYPDGHTETGSAITRTADFNDDYNGDFAKETSPFDGFLVLDAADYPGAVSVTVGTLLPDGGRLSDEYRIVDSCSRYSVCYRNAYGGWDSLLLEGLCSMSDALTRHNAQRSYSNSLAANRGTFNFCNEMTRQWTLRTGWMTDSQSMRMHHLLNSPDVYLYDSLDGLYRPVVLTDTETEYRTYRGNGRRMVSYEMNAQLAQPMQRR